MTTDAPAARSPRVSARGLVMAVAVWAVVCGAAFGLAMALNSPVGEGARDPAQAVAAAPAVDEQLANLPPLALVLDAALPADIAALPVARQVARLRARAADSGQVGHMVELGSGQQQVDDQAGAERTYRSVLSAHPSNVAAQVGLALAASRTGGTLEGAAAELERLAAAHPDDQTVAFNQGWVEFYRLDGASAYEAFTRTLGLGASTRLGRTAQALLAALDEGALGVKP